MIARFMSFYKPGVTAFYVIIYMCQWDNLVYIEWENQQHGKGFHILNILLPEHKIRNEIVHNGMKLQPN